MTEVNLFDLLKQSFGQIGRQIKQIRTYDLYIKDIEMLNKTNISGKRVWLASGVYELTNTLECHDVSLYGSNVTIKGSIISTGDYVHIDGINIDGNLTIITNTFVLDNCSCTNLDIKSCINISRINLYNCDSLCIYSENMIISDILNSKRIHINRGNVLVSKLIVNTISVIEGSLLASLCSIDNNLKHNIIITNIGVQ